MIVRRDDVDLHVVEEGSGPPVVLLHGHTLDLRAWDLCVPVLRAAGFTVVRYDQRGHGRSSSPARGYGWSDHIEDLAAVVSSRAGGRAHLVGMSKGGGIAIGLSLAQPGSVASLSLIGPLVPGFTLSARLVESFRDLARAIRKEGVSRAVAAHWLAHPLIATAAAQPAVRGRIEAMLGTFPAGEYLAEARSTGERGGDSFDRLAEIAAPTLVVRGEREVPDFVAMSEAIGRAVPGARSVVVAGSGHLVALERPDVLARELVAFVTAAVGGR